MLLAIHYPICAHVPFISIFLVFPSNCFRILESIEIKQKVSKFCIRIFYKNSKGKRKKKEAEKRNVNFDPFDIWREYPFKQNKNMSIYIQVLLLTYFYHNILNALRLTFCNIYDLTFLHFPKYWEKWRSKLDKKLFFQELLHQQICASL